LGEVEKPFASPIFFSFPRIVKDASEGAVIQVQSSEVQQFSGPDRSGGLDAPV